MPIESELDSSISSAKIVKEKGPQNRALRHTCDDISPIGESTFDDYSRLSIVKEITQPVEVIVSDTKML